MTLLFVALGLFAAGAIVALAALRSPRRASWVGSGAAVAGCACAGAFAVKTLVTADVSRFEAPWGVPNGSFVVGCDPLSAFFLVPVCVLGAVAAVYGREYMLAYAGRKLLGPPWAAYNVLLASMVLVTVARQGLLFLVAWELMTLSSYALVVFEYEEPPTQRAGWVYLIAAHVGTACLIGLFVLLGARTGTLVFGAAPLDVDGRTRVIVLLLALVGFGVKAGVVPLHVWLPEAHAAAPSHVSAVMSGVVVKMGVYGLVRASLLVGPPPAWWGGGLVVLGLAGAFAGITLATYQRDIKRVLAYSTVENVGIILLGLGLGFWGSATGHPVAAALGTWGALLHVWNHTVMKGLLFLGAGCVVHATGTRDLERLGGLMRRMPAVGALFVVGAVAVAGLPPLNGFVGEWLVYRSMLESAIHTSAGLGTAFVLAVGTLSIVGALAALTFLRLATIAFLGQPRSEAAERAHDAGGAMRGSMVALAALAILGGVRPQLVTGAITLVSTKLAMTASPAGPAAIDVAGGLGVPSSEIDSALGPLSIAATVLWLVLAITAAIVVVTTRRQPADTQPTWGCGYAAPTRRMQYTGRAFAQLSGILLPSFLRARGAAAPPAGWSPAAGRSATAPEDPGPRGGSEPARDGAARRFARLRWLQQGVVHLYILYMLVAVILGLGWAALHGALG